MALMVTAIIVCFILACIIGGIVWMAMEPPPLYHDPDDDHDHDTDSKRGVH